MGQANGKDNASRGGYGPSGSARRGVPVTNTRQGAAGGMRTQTVNDALVAPQRNTATAHHDTGAAPPEDRQRISPQSPPTVDSRRDPASGLQSPNGTGAGAPNAHETAIPPSPVVIRYKNTDAKALIERKTPVDILIQDPSAVNDASKPWSRIPMSRSDDTYFVIVNLPPGEHRFRFSLPDRGTVVDPSQPTIQDNSTGGSSEPANVIQVSADIMTTKDDDDLIDDGVGWGHVETQFEETRKYPPMLPPHLRYTPLNTPPTQIRCHHDGLLNVAASTLEAEHLPLPLSVTINHVYFQKREDHIVSGITTRHCNKFTTIAYYRSIETQSASTEGGASSAVPITTHQ